MVKHFERMRNGFVFSNCDAGGKICFALAGLEKFYGFNPGLQPGLYHFGLSALRFGKQAREYGDRQDACPYTDEGIAPLVVPRRVARRR
jgi:hypothetical protein